MHVLVVEIYDIFNDYAFEQISISNVMVYVDDVAIEVNSDNASVFDYYEGDWHTIRVSLFNEYGADEEKGENAVIDALSLESETGRVTISFDLTLV